MSKKANNQSTDNENTSKKIGFFKQLKALTWEQKIFFSTALCQRMFPNYELFSEISKIYSPKILQDYIDLLWTSIYTKTDFNINSIIEKLDSMTPDADDYDMYGVQPAIDAIVAVSLTFSAIDGKLEQDLINISKLSSSTVAYFIEETNEFDAELSEDELADIIFLHPTMKNEQYIQNEILEFVVNCQDPTQKEIMEFKKLLIESPSNIGI